MKKTLLFFSMMLMTVIAMAQKPEELPVPALPIDDRTQLVTYQDVIQQQGTPQELYDRALIWVKKYYKNTAEVIKSQDRDKAVIQMHSSVKIYSKQKDGKQVLHNIVYYDFKLECKDNRYRYTITNFNEKASSAAPIEKWFQTDRPSWNASEYDFLNQIDEQIQALINSLEDGMLPPEVIKDDW